MPKVPNDSSALTPVRDSVLDPSLSSGASYAPAQPDAPVTFYWTILRRYWTWILSFVLVCTVGATLVALVLPKRYSATAELRIDPASDHTVGQSSNSDTNVSLSARELITTEADEITSPAVVLAAINATQLYKNSEFAPVLSAGASPTAPISDAGMNDVLRKVTQAISVSQPLDTYLLQVSFRSHDPQLSATVANALLDALIQHDYETRVEALTGSSESMRAQLINLQAKMESSQADLVNYESSNDVLNPDSSTNIMQARLSQVNQSLGQAQTQRMALQADYDVARGGDLDALIASDRGQYLLPLDQRLLADQRVLAQMSQMYGPNYPVYKQQQALVQHDQQVLQQQELHVANQIKSEYQAAQGREVLLHDELSLQKQAMDAFNLKAIRYSSLKAAADAYTKLYYQLQQSVQDATVAASLHSESLRVISPARPIQTPVYPRPLLTAALAFLLSTLVGAGAALALGVLDRSVSTPEQVEFMFGLPVLGALPQVLARDTGQLSPAGFGPKLLGGDAQPESGAATDGGRPASLFRESVLGLHSALMLMRERDIHVLAITSSVPGEGKTTVSANLAAAFAAMAGRTVLVDTDMRKPGVHRQFGVSNRRGLSTLLRGQCLLDQVLIPVPGVPNLTVLPGGPMPSSPAQLLHLGLEDLLEQLRGRFEFVIFDCPPVLGFADALSPANLADGCILVVRAGQTERQLVSGALRQLQSARTEILGVVLNNVSQRPGAYYSYYSHYYEYHHQASEGGADGEAVDD